jgi:hypothetical protein
MKSSSAYLEIKKVGLACIECRTSKQVAVNLFPYDWVDNDILVYPMLAHTSKNDKGLEWGP